MVLLCTMRTLFYNECHTSFALSLLLAVTYNIALFIRKIQPFATLSFPSLDHATGHRSANERLWSALASSATIMWVSRIVWGITVLSSPHSPVDHLEKSWHYGN